MEKEESLSQKIRIMNGFITNKLYKFKKGYPLIISGSNNGYIQIWNRFTGEELRSIKTTQVMKIVKVCCPIYLTGHYSGEIKLWDLRESRELLSNKESGDAIKDIISINKTGTYASSGNDKMIRIWFLTIDPPSLLLLKVLSGHGDWVDCMDLLPNGELASASANGEVNIWDWEQGVIKRNMKVASGWIAHIMHYTHLQETRLITFSTEGKLEEWDLQSTNNLHSLHSSGTGSNWSKVLILLPNNRLTFQEKENRVAVFNLNTNQVIIAPKHQDKDISEGNIDQIMHLERNSIVSSHGNGDIKIWQVNEHEIQFVRLLRKENDRIICLNKDNMNLLKA